MLNLKLFCYKCTIENGSCEILRIYASFFPMHIEKITKFIKQKFSGEPLKNVSKNVIKNVNIVDLCFTLYVYNKILSILILQPNLIINCLISLGENLLNHFRFKQLHSYREAHITVVKKDDFWTQVNFKYFPLYHRPFLLN